MKHRVVNLGPGHVFCATCHTCIKRAKVERHVGREHRRNLDAANAERHARRERREAGSVREHTCF